MRAEIDPISLEIMWSRLISIANQGATALLRTSFSTLVGFAQDFKYALTDSRGTSIAPSDAGDALFFVTFPHCLKAMLRVIPPESLEPGDVLITNDPWLAAGHNNDIHIATPVFFRRKLVAFAGSVIHISDIGGRYAPYDSREVFEEGLCLPVMKLHKRGSPTSEVYDILTANVRAPEMQLGDIRAMLAANEVGAQLLVEFMQEHELSDLTALADAVQSKVEGAMRTAIGGIPDGTYEHETYVDGFSQDVRIKSAITVQGNEMTVDYTGSSPQTNEYSINCVLSLTKAMTVHPLKAILAPHIPANEGAIRPIEVIAPEGSILNCIRPAAVRSRAMVGMMLPDHLLGALAPILPKQVTAEMGSRWVILTDRAPVGGRRAMSAFFQAGGMGAAHHKDGPSARIFPPIAAHTSIELFESYMGLLVREQSLRQDSGGPGHFRGGLGQRVVVENPEATGVDFTFWQPRVHHPAQGIWEGKPGAAGLPLLNEMQIEGGRWRLESGDRAVFLTPGGGGFGNPLTRDPAQVAADVANGYVSVASARDDYGVAVNQAGDIDNEATELLRRQRRSPGDDSNRDLTSGRAGRLVPNHESDSTDDAV